MAAFLLFVSGRCQQTSVPQAPDTRETLMASDTAYTLSLSYPAAYIPVIRKDADAGKTILEVRVTKVINPAKIPVQINFFLAVENTAMPRISVGSLSLFPADQPGRLLLDLSSQMQSEKLPYQLLAVLAAEGAHPDKDMLELRVEAFVWR